MKQKANTRTALLALAAALPLTAGLVFAQTAAPGRVQPAQPGQSTPRTGTAQTQSNTNYADLFLQRLAAQLGISVERLRAAAVAAGNATIDQAVRNGDISQNRAADLKARLQDAPLNFGRFGGQRGPDGALGRGNLNGQTEGRGARVNFGQAVAAAVARALGLSEQTLVQQLQNGQTIRSLAQARNVNTQTIRNAAITALRTSLNAEVQAGRLTQAQAAELVQRAQADANFGLNLGFRGRGGFNRGGQDGPRGFGQPSGQDGEGAESTLGT